MAYNDGVDFDGENYINSMWTECDMKENQLSEDINDTVTFIDIYDLGFCESR